VFVHDRCGDAVGCTPSTILASATAAGGAGASVVGPQLSPSGRFLIFGTEASDLVAGDVNDASDAFVRDLCLGAAGCTPETRRVSINAAGEEGSGDSNSDVQYTPGKVTDLGLSVWASWAGNLVTDDGNGTADIFLAASGFTP